MTIIKGLQKGLYKFQLEDVLKIEAKNGRVLLGSEMGLGKTAQSLAWLQLHPEKRPVIIIVPASLKLNWQQEIRMWLPNPKIQILSGTKTVDKIAGDFIIINYDIIHSWVDQLRCINPQVIITDEAHYYKNNKAKRTRAVKMLAKGAPHILVLSGTPIVNRPIEIFNALKIIDPKIMPDRWTFAMRYCGAYNNGFGWSFDGASHTEELHQRLATTIMIRRKKADVLKDLPPKIRAYIPLELENRKDYDEAESDFINWLTKERGAEAAKRASNAEIFAKTEILKQIATAGKLKQAINWIENFIENGEKLVVFTTHIFTVNTLTEHFKEKSAKLDGSVSITNREKTIMKFQTDESVRLLIGNIKVAGVGINLTAASNVAFVELGWTPGEHDQAEDRVHRIGQTAQSITAYYLLAAGTIEEKIVKLIDRKRWVLDMVLDGKKTEKESLLSELIKEYRKEK